MENIFLITSNLVIITLCIGAFFISNTKVIKGFALVSVFTLFTLHSLGVAPQQQLSNISLVLINAFYLFKVYTQYQLEQSE